MVAQIITIVNQSGKIVKTSKTLVNVFTEAKVAYNEKKAELKAQRDRGGDKDDRRSERKVRKQLEVMTLADEDTRSRRSSRHSESGRSVRRKPVSSHSERPPVERGYSDSFYANDDRRSKPRTSSHRPSPLQFGANGELDIDEPQIGELVRRHTSGFERQLTQHQSQPPTRSASYDDIDMSLAYGELPPPLPARRGDDTLELREKMTSLQRLLEECHCLQHSVTATIDNLSKNPDTMAAVALTLAEISSLATKLAPGALTALKGSFPAIIAMLASPQFAIAAGVGVGVTIIALGGYKIVKKIQARKEETRMLEYGDFEPESPAESVDELRELDRIEIWRRGIADADAEEQSLATSVDGEFLTPIATRTLIEEGKLTEADLKSTTSSRKSKKKSAKGESSSKTSKSKSKSSVKGSKSRKEKEPSGLRMLFKSHAKA